MELPLFVSFARLKKRKSVLKPTCKWALDSGAFSEIARLGSFETSPKEYANFVKKIYLGGRNNLDFASIQDWMCEPVMLRRTGLTVFEHQKRTIESWVKLKSLAPEVPWLPVIQGYKISEYENHVRLYDQVDSTWRKGRVGLGSVCKRQRCEDVASLIKNLHTEGIKLHAFGFKTTALPKLHKFLVSSDSMAWSYEARRSPPLPECEGSNHKNCANCKVYALKWRERILEKLR